MYMQQLYYICFLDGLEKLEILRAIRNKTQY